MIQSVFSCGAHVGRTGPARLCGAGRGDARHRGRAGLAVALAGRLRAQGRGALHRHDARDALQPRLRHDGARARDRVPRRARPAARLRARTRISALARALDRAAGRAQRRASDAGPARRHRDAGDVRCSFCIARAAISRTAPVPAVAGRNNWCTAPDGIALDLASNEHGARAARWRNRHEADRRANPPVRRARLSVLPELLFRGRDRADAHRGRRDPAARARGSLAREIGRAAHRVRGAQVQRGVPPARASSAPGRRRWSRFSARSSTSTSSSSTPRPRSRATCGNGTRTTAPGRATTACRSRAR